MLRSIILFLIIIINIVIQSTVINLIAINTITPNLILITVVSLGLLRGRTEGAISGVALGLLVDIFFGHVLGFYTLVYFYIGFLSGYMHKNFYRDSLLIPSSIIGLSDFIFGMTVYLLTYFFRGRTDLVFYLGNIIIPEVVYTTLFGIGVYRIYYYINSKIEKEELRKENKDKVWLNQNLKRT